MWHHGYQGSHVPFVPNNFLLPALNAAAFIPLTPFCYSAALISSLHCLQEGKEKNRESMTLRSRISR